MKVKYHQSFAHTIQHRDTTQNYGRKQSANQSLYSGSTLLMRYVFLEDNVYHIIKHSTQLLPEKSMEILIGNVKILMAQISCWIFI